ncbi:uncharacterized protein [Ptychodera flava]|uniref:uncharacterized protein isoform X2 n=1 Tax=Ptychodera flava TaxID=63121 RepID=UPI003969D28E
MASGSSTSAGTGEPRSTAPPNWPLFRKTPYSKLKTNVKRKIGMYLSDSYTVANDWVVLAEALGLDNDEITMIRLEGRKEGKLAGEIMLDLWSNKGNDSTVKVLEDLLIGIQRYDVLDVLYQALCQLTCTVIMDQDNTVDLPREELTVPEQDSLRVALDGPLRKLGFSPDDLEVNLVSDRKITWDTETHVLKGYHIYLSKKIPIQMPEVSSSSSPSGTEGLSPLPENDNDDVEVITPTSKSANEEPEYANLDVNFGWHQYLPDNKYEIIKVMRDYLKADGYFIIRRTKEGHLAVSVTYMGKIKHFKIYKRKGLWYFYRDGERKDSIEGLIKYYMDMPLVYTQKQLRESNNSEAPPLPPRVSLKLKYPVCVDRKLEESHRTLKY